MQGARHPHGPGPVAEVALQLAEDRRLGVAAKGNAAGRIEPVHGIHQAEAGDLKQVVEGLGDPGVAGRHAARHRHVELDQLLPRAGVSGDGEPPPELPFARHRQAVRDLHSEYIRSPKTSPYAFLAIRFTAFLAFTALPAGRPRRSALSAARPPRGDSARSPRSHRRRAPERRRLLRRQVEGGRALGIELLGYSSPRMFPGAGPLKTAPSSLESSATSDRARGVRRV